MRGGLRFRERLFLWVGVPVAEAMGRRTAGENARSGRRLQRGIVNQGFEDELVDRSRSPISLQGMKKSELVGHLSRAVHARGRGAVLVSKVRARGG